MLHTAVPTPETYEAIASELAHRSNTEVLYFSSAGFQPYGKPWKKIKDHYFSTR